MRRQYLIFLAVLVLFFSLLIDGQVSTLVTNWLPGRLAISSHFLFMVGLFFAEYLGLRSSLIVFTMLGLLYDIYYLGILGIAITLFPLCIFLVYYFDRPLSMQRVMNSILLVVVLFVLEFASFLFARLFHMTNLSVYILLVYNLVPSLLFNLLVFIAIQPLLERAFGITNKT